MKTITMTITSAVMALGTIPLASPAAAQGSVGPIKRIVNCPIGYSRDFGVNGGMCYPQKNLRSVPQVYIPEKKGNCASGYRPDGAYCTTEPASDGISAADKLVSYGTIAKANKLDRCPLGYFSKADMTICTTRLSPAPKSRKKTGPCNSNEIDEWGLYCTADANVITRAQAQQEADRDFNAIYSANGAQYPAQGSDTENYPSMVAAYGPKGGGSASAASATGSGDSQTAQTSGCANGSATGAAIGGAMAGEGGAALGSMLGGLGKKKKKQGC